MNISGRYPFAATPQDVWEVICDPAVLQLSIPQCESIERINEHQWRGTARVKVGPLGTSFSGLITLSNLNPPHSYTITIDAESWMGKSSGSADVTLTATDSGCELAYTATVHVGIKALDKAMDMATGLAHTLADKFFARLAEQIAARKAAEKSNVASG